VQWEEGYIGRGMTPGVPMHWERGQWLAASPTCLICWVNLPDVVFNKHATAAASGWHLSQGFSLASLG
jgi:hypothetical protein